MTASASGAHAGKVAFVPGATSGIGRATALAFGREGASVAVADVSEDGVRETARMIEEAGGKALAMHPRERGLPRHHRDADDGPLLRRHARGAPARH